MPARDPDDPGPQVLLKIVYSVVGFITGCGIVLIARWLMGY
jgi:hypothetical protein